MENDSGLSDAGYGGHAGDGLGGEVGGMSPGFSGEVSDASIADLAPVAYDDSIDADNVALSASQPGFNFSGVFGIARAGLDITSRAMSAMTSPLSAAREALNFAEMATRGGGRAGVSYSNSAPSFTGGGDYWLSAAPANFDRKINPIAATTTAQPAQANTVQLSDIARVDALPDVTPFAVNVAPGIVEPAEKQSPIIPVILGLLIFWGIA